MKSTDLSFLVLDAGAIRGIAAALLKNNGYNVEIVCKYDEYEGVKDFTDKKLTGGHFKS